MPSFDLTVRMYNVGFGDSFLVSYTADGQRRRILIDCGSHLSGAGPRPIREVARQIIQDVTVDADAPRLDVVVATHRHYDHIAGFDADDWARVEVGEVWLPWIEHPHDPTARRIRNAQTKLATALAVSRGGPQGASVEALAMNSLSNDGAMKTLLHGFAGRPEHRFLPEADGDSHFETPELPDMRVHILGPSRDETVIRDLEPPHDESYLRMIGGDAMGLDPLLPFIGHGESDPELEGELAIKKLHEALDVDEFDFAVALEDAVNGTSLVLALELGAAVLLFGGDAQWGTWKAAMEVPHWQELLRRTTFLKVGHHGSHNATPKTLVEDYLPDDLLAMVSVNRVDRWPFIPKSELLARLEEKRARIARSDKRRVTPEGFRRHKDWWTEVDVPT